MKLVIVDDQPFMLRTIERQIPEIPDLQLFAFEDPEAALAWCQENDPDLILVDYMMPKLNGVEFIQKLRATPDRENTMILMLTGAKEPELLLQALEEGANDFLHKPANLWEMKARILSMLRLRGALISLKAANRELTRLATTDALTEALNRRAFLERANAAVSFCRRDDKPFSVVMLDIDHFKRV
ncbi:MAG: response regulator, partial [Elsteraceae bacterium]